LYDRALKDSDRLQKLVENLLLVNKVEAGRLPIAMENANLSLLIKELVHNSYAEELAAEKVVLSLQDDIVVKADMLALQSVVSNLIDNAFKYAAGSQVRISLQNTGMVMLEVSDHGPGIPDEDKKKVFERFYRLGSEETRMTKGTGIGLYLVRLLVELHDGKIDVEDNQPTGSVFKVSLPQIIN
jgi:signal transduction histidine kinase